MTKIGQYYTHKLYFVNSKRVSREIMSLDGTHMTDAQIRKVAFAKMNEFCDERNFKIYYVRSWNEPGRTVFDVGSHTEFFHLVPEVKFEAEKETSEV